MQDTISTRSIVDLFKRCNEQTDPNCGPMAVSTWEKTGIPVVISVVLFSLVFAVLFYIVRKRRILNKKREEEAATKIDMDDVEDRAAFAKQYGGGKK